jgi:hypothetical protein
VQGTVAVQPADGNALRATVRFPKLGFAIHHCAAAAGVRLSGRSGSHRRPSR